MLAGYRHLLAAARRLQWDSEKIDLSLDRRRWEAAEPSVRDPLRLLLAGFWVAEQQVAEQLAPFIAESLGDARTCFELQAADERRHAAFFARVLREVVGIDPEGEARTLAGPRIVELFDGALPSMASALAAGEVELPEAVSLYHLVLEAIVLSTGQEALLERAAAFPGIADGVARVQADERWHVGLGVHAVGGALPERLDALAGHAAAAWGPALAPTALIERALAGHRRRTNLLARTTLDRDDT